ncbi:glycosyltransferase [Salinibacterium sp. M195]|uniref:glycosyltransferase n=1 Tax=Salinibacterium sp. M195 TaxID=2583374 RepID=UPI001C638D28|nr:glycosyltransferase [Salinibacterium sp. M195]QYH35608.1 glycosyltransferase family 4 protein [Salinibacterium sp. M195]
MTAQRKRAIIASRVYAPEGTAAAYRLEQLTIALEARGYSVAVLTTRAPGGPHSTAQIRRWPVLRDSSGSVRGYLQYASFDIPLFFRLLFAPRAAFVVVEPPPTTGLVSRIALAVRRMPYFYYSADVTSAAVKTINAPRLVVKLVTAMERYVLKGARGVLAVSEGVRQELDELMDDTSKVTVVGTGVDTSIYRPDGPHAPADAPYFVYAGTMSEFQGSEVFAEAFLRVAQQHPTIRLDMFGGGVDVKKLKKILEPASDRVTFHGFVESAVVAAHLRGAQAGLASVRPGVGYDFAIPTKALVSVACGTPLVFAGVGPIRTLAAEHALGWAVDWDIAAVAEAMLDAANSSATTLAAAKIDWLGAHYSLQAAAERGCDAIELSLASSTLK